MKFFKEFQALFAKRAKAVRFVYTHKTIVNRKMRRSADAELRRSPPPSAERIKLCHEILAMPKNVPAVRVVDEKPRRAYVPMPRRRVAS